jgi:dUTPase
MMLKIDTGMKVKLPLGHCGIIKPRSGLALDHQIDVLGGVILYLTYNLIL